MVIFWEVIFMKGEKKIDEKKKRSWERYIKVVQDISLNDVDLKKDPFELDLLGCSDMFLRWHDSLSIRTREFLEGKRSLENRCFAE
jgi:hypothetical protein